MLLRLLTLLVVALAYLQMRSMYIIAGLREDLAADELATAIDHAHVHNHNLNHAGETHTPKHCKCDCKCPACPATTQPANTTKRAAGLDAVASAVVASTVGSTTAGPAADSSLQLLPPSKQGARDVPLEQQYLPWEKASITVGTKPGVCRPPPGTPERCCIGGISYGGDVFWGPDHCNWQENFVKFKYQKPLYTVGQLMQTLSRLNLNLTFAGDSVMYQNVVGLECDWLRQGCTSTHAALQTLHPENWRYGVGMHEEWNVTCPVPPKSGDGPRKMAAVAKPVLVHYYLEYRPNNDFVQTKYILNRTDIFVFNVGLHYLSTEAAQYKKEMKNYMSVIYEWQKGDPKRIAIYRETTQQHRDSSGGEWMQRVGSMKCKDVKFTAAHKRKWRVQLARKTAAEVGWTIVDTNVESLEADARNEVNMSNPKLFWVPFYDYTVPQMTMHPHWDSNTPIPANPNANNPLTACEPSHFCQTPLFWDQISSNITLLMNSETISKQVNRK